MIIFQIKNGIDTVISTVLLSKGVKIEDIGINLKNLNTEKLDWFKYVMDLLKANDNILTDTKGKVFEELKKKKEEELFDGISECKNSHEKHLTVPAVLDSEYKHLMESQKPRLQPTIDITLDIYDEAFRHIKSTAHSPSLSVIGPLDDENEFPNAFSSTINLMLVLRTMNYRVGENH
ncbi:7042_t:CDS:2, partial [Ambispora leptoticha]